MSGVADKYKIVYSLIGLSLFLLGMIVSHYMQRLPLKQKVVIMTPKRVISEIADSTLGIKIP